MSAKLNYFSHLFNDFSKILERGHASVSTTVYTCRKVHHRRLEAEGIEPPTFCMQSRHSTTELRPRDKLRRNYNLQSYILDHIILEFTIAFF